jgi:polysaccharide biosynthesis PFTS motif protein
LAYFNAQRDTSYLLTSFAFNRAIANYYASKSIFIFPLNKQWQKIFIEHGIEVNRNFCSFLWKSFKAILMIKSFIDYFKFLFASILEKLKHPKKIKSEKYDSLKVYFYDITERNLPSFNNKVYEKNIITWYKKFFLKDYNMNVLHNVKKFSNKNDFDLGYCFTYNKSLFFPPNIFAEFTNLFWWISLFLKNISNSNNTVILMGNFNEILKAKRVHDLNDHLDLCAVVFNNSIGSIKPLWAVVLERNHVRVDYCFYACNAEPVDIEGNLPIDGFWAMATWENYYVVDEYQKNQLENQLMYKPSKIVFEAIPWWTDTNSIIPSTNKKTICLFDTILHKNSFIPATINQYGWYKLEVAILYFETVLEVALTLDVNVYYKIKRIRGKNIRNQQHWDYIQKTLEVHKKNIILIDDKVSAERLIQSADIIVSKPVSTTGLIAKNLNKPSIFFDPTGKIHNSDPALRGIPVLGNKAELMAYMIKIFTIKD